MAWAGLGLFLFSGCSFMEIHLAPEIQPLEEKVVRGDSGPKVLLVDIRGMISNRKRTSLMGHPLELGMVEQVREIIKKAEKDEKIQALLLRINSPGGTVTSSDIIFHELEEFKKRRKIKIYALMMDVAASGGYYIALAADRIIAHPTSITGSIGVITIKVNLAGLMDKVGVDWEVVKSGEKKDFLSPFRALTPEERRLFQETIDSFHNRFLEHIARHRPGLENLQEVRALADGRVFTSDQALRLKLIDHIGYMDETEALIKKDLGVEAVQLVAYHRPGDYKSNWYSRMDSGTSFQLIRLDANFLPENPGPHFLYMWMP